MKELNSGWSHQRGCLKGPEDLLLDAADILHLLDEAAVLPDPGHSEVSHPRPHREDEDVVAEGEVPPGRLAEVHRGPHLSSFDVDAGRLALEEVHGGVGRPDILDDGAVLDSAHGGRGEHGGEDEEGPGRQTDHLEATRVDDLEQRMGAPPRAEDEHPRPASRGGAR